MYRYAVFLILFFVLLAGCAQPGPEGTPPPAAETAVPATGTAAPATEAATPHSLPTPTSPPAPAPTEAAAPTPTEDLSVAATQEPAEPAGWIAFIGEDSNVWLVDPAGEERRQVTQDAVPWPASGQPEEPVIVYWRPEWSSDGRLLAFLQEVDTPVESGIQVDQSLWVYDLESGEAKPVLAEGQVTGFAWKPGEHLIAYGLPINQDYLFGEGGPVAELAGGLFVVEVDPGSSYELVPPERGYHLVGPRWSPDGRFLSFEEVQNIEGRGLFAYYDVGAQEYVAWEEAIGSYSWAPDGEQIAYDRMIYIPEGTEQIWLNDRRGESEQPLSPDYEDGYAHNPVFSPQGGRLVYLGHLGSFENPQETIFVIEVPGGEPISLGEFEQPLDLYWSPDGERLYFSAGPYDQAEVVEVSLADGTVRTIAQGKQPAPQPLAP